MNVTLPPARAGHYYQAWLKNAAGLAVTVGTFHARQGGHDIVLWSGVDPHDFRVLTVTDQRIGGRCVVVAEGDAERPSPLQPLTLAPAARDSA